MVVVLYRNKMIHSHYQVGAGYEHYPQDHSQLIYDNYGNDGICFNSIVIQMYNSFGKHSHTAVICDNYVDYDGGLGYYHTYCDNSHNVAQYSMSFTNYAYQLNGQCAYVVYIHGDFEDKVTGYYLYVQSIDGSPHTLIPFLTTMQGPLQIVRTVVLRIVVVSKHNFNIQTTESNNPQLAFENYVQDLKTYENHGCSYKDHITDIIDALMDSSDDTMDNDCMSRSAMHACVTTLNSTLIQLIQLYTAPVWALTVQVIRTNARITERAQTLITRTRKLAL